MRHWSQLPFYNLELSLPNSAYIKTLRSVVSSFDSPKSAEFTAIDLSMSCSLSSASLSNKNESCYLNCLLLWEGSEDIGCKLMRVFGCFGLLTCDLAKSRVFIISIKFCWKTWFGVDFLRSLFCSSSLNSALMLSSFYW